MNKPRTRTIFIVFCGLQTKESARMVSDSRVCSKQQDVFSN